jgi:predicted aspartyl protease
MGPGGTLTIDDMGSFRIDVEVENPAQPGTRREIRNVLIDTGAELSCFPADVLEALGIARTKPLRLRQADGSILERWSGFGIVHAAGTLTTDEIVFGDRADLVLLGCRTLEGLNLRVDPVAKRLIDAGPMPFAVAGNTSLIETAGCS